MGTQAKDETFNPLDVLFKESVRYRINGRIDKVFYTPRHNSVMLCYVITYYIETANIKSVTE